MEGETFNTIKKRRIVCDVIDTRDAVGEGRGDALSLVLGTWRLVSAALHAARWMVPGVCGLLVRAWRLAPDAKRARGARMARRAMMAMRARRLKRARRAWMAMMTSWTVNVRRVRRATLKRRARRARRPGRARRVRRERTGRDHPP